MLIRRTNTRRKERDRRMGIKPRTRAKSSRVERGWCYCWWWWWWCCCCNSWRGGDGNEVAAGRVKGINSNSICKAQLSDKVKSLFEANTHPHTQRASEMKNEGRRTRGQPRKQSDWNKSCRVAGGRQDFWNKGCPPIRRLLAVWEII